MRIKPCLFLSLAIVFLFTSGCSSVFRKEPVTYSFAALADCQYCADKSKGVRLYSKSAKKLEDCVFHLNEMDLKFAIHLGDFIDKGFDNFDVLNPIYDRLKFPKYHVLGNHDFSVKDNLKDKVPEKMGLSSRYYSFEYLDWRYIVLDGNDISFHAYPKGSEEIARATDYYRKHKVTSPKWNGAIGPQQVSWLKESLEKAQSKNEKVMVFCHFPVYPKDIHNLWNAEEVVELLSQFNCVKAYINGHNHKGHYGVKHGIHFVTLKGMVDTEENSYAVVKVSEKSIEVKGFGRESDRKMMIKPFANK